MNLNEAWDKIKCARTDADCYAIAKEIHAYIDSHKGCALEGKTIILKKPKKPVRHKRKQPPFFIVLCMLPFVLLLWMLGWTLYVAGRRRV